MTYATGKYSRAICDRCGFAFDYPELNTEPGTSYRVCAVCNDGMYSLKLHPQNTPPPVSPDPQALRYARTQESIVSAVGVSAWLDLLQPSTLHRGGFDGG